MNSKKQSSLLLIIGISAFLISFSALGRAPAVEPVSGISIDEYREVNPKDDPGFNWNQDKSRHIRLKNKKSSLSRAYDSTTSLAMTSFFILAIIAFPIGLWFTLIKSFPTLASSTEQEIENSAAINLAAERSKRVAQDENHTENKHDIDKAS